MYCYVHIFYIFAHLGYGHKSLFSLNIDSKKQWRIMSAARACVDAGSAVTPSAEKVVYCF